MCYTMDMPTYEAVLSKTSTDKVKSRLLSPLLSELTFDVYCDPSDFSRIIQTLYDQTFTIKLVLDNKEI